MRRLFPNATFVAPKQGAGLRLVISDAPGESDELLGEPLSGGSGKWFDSMCRKAGIKRDGIWITNVIQCRPPDNHFPTDQEARTYISAEDAHKAVHQCVKNHIEPLLKARPWQRIDILGDKPLQFVCGKSQGSGDGIYKWRGSPLAVPAIDPNKLIAIPTIHPASIARDQTMLPVVINDLMKGLTPPPEDYTLYPSLTDLQDFHADLVCFDIETAGWSQEIKMVGIAKEPYKVLVVPFNSAYLPELQRIFSEAKEVVGHNCVQFDLPILEKNGVTISPDCKVWDTMLMHHLRYPDLGGDNKSGAGHDLEFLGSQFTNKPAWKHQKGTNEQLYCARDVDVTIQSFLQLKPLLAQAQLTDIHDYISVPLGKICRLMQVTGFTINPAHIESVREKLLKEMEAKEAQIPEQLRTVWKEVNKREPAPPGTLSPKTGKPLKFITVPAKKRVVPWRSTDRKLEWLYGTGEPWHLGLPMQYDMETNRPTTGKIALDRLVNMCRKSKDPKWSEAVPAIQALKRLNQLDELETTFCKTDMLKIEKMHPHFNVHGTASGRLSSSDPNLQNVPESARFIYVPSEPGWKIIDVDYSQLENRLTAFLAGDIERLHRFESIPGFSEHKYAASMFLDIPYNEVVKDNDKDAPYGKAKRIVHGTNYLMGSRKIAKMYDMDLKETKDLQAKWKKAIWPSVQWMGKIADEAERNGYLTNPFARKRWFWTESAATEAASFIPQSSGADIVFRAMIALMYERIGWKAEYALKVAPLLDPLPQPARLLIQVHDSLVFECPAELVPEVVRVVARVMTQPWPELRGFSIPIGVKVGDSWGEAEDYKL